MKQFILICAACLWGFSSVLAVPTTPPDGGGRLNVRFYIGHGRDCVSWGICDIEIMYMSDPSILGGLGVGGLQISPDKRYFELSFSRDDVEKYQPEKMVFLDGKSEVTFETGYVFSEEVRKGLEADRDLIITPGSYPLRFVDGLFTIKFPY
jgi:hypothetical protein